MTDLKVFTPEPDAPRMPPVPEVPNVDEHLRDRIDRVLSSGKLPNAWQKLDAIMVIIHERESELKAAVLEKLADIKELLR